VSSRVILPSWMWAMSRQRPPQLWAGQPVRILVIGDWELVSKRLISLSVEDMSREG